MKHAEEQIFTGERALFAASDSAIHESIFEDGESPLKESRNIDIDHSIFRWKYPLWYSKNTTVRDSALLEGARAGMWYTNHLDIENTTIQAPKALRRSSHIRLTDVDMPQAEETLWTCSNVTLKNVSAQGNYFAMNSTNIEAENFRLSGNYSFDGCKEVHISNAHLLSKDAFWNCENVVVTDSFITGEYLGWNSRNLTFINCTIESLQGFCYIDGLTLKNCRLINTNLAFEYCEKLDVEVTTVIDSIKNPMSGSIRAKGITEIIFDDPDINPNKTAIALEGLKHAV